MISRVVRDNSYGWMVVGICFVSLMLVYAVRSSLGLMMPFWEDDPGWTRDLSSDAGALVLILMAISSPIAGNLIDRYGPRPVCSAGLACLGAGVFAVTLSSEACRASRAVSVFHARRVASSSPCRCLGCW
jgi:MFS family permease